MSARMQKKPTASNFMITPRAHSPKPFAKHWHFSRSLNYCGAFGSVRCPPISPGNAPQHNICRYIRGQWTVEKPQAPRSQIRTNTKLQSVPSRLEVEKPIEYNIHCANVLRCDGIQHLTRGTLGGLAADKCQGLI